MHVRTGFMLKLTLKKFSYELHALFTNGAYKLPENDAGNSVNFTIIP